MTIRQLARIAGVSHATVSRALRDSPRISLEVRERIKKLALETGYQPHPLVSRLMAQLPHIKEISRTTLAVVTASWPDWRTRAFPLEVFTGVELRAKELGYRVEEFALAEYGSCRRLSDVLYARGIEGVIIMPLLRSPGHLSLKWERFSSVTIGRTLIQPPLHRVTFAHHQNIVLALRRMRRLGYKRIALALDEGLSGRVENAYVAEFLAYQRTIADVDRVPIFQAPGPPVPEAVEWLRMHRADAILCNYSPTPAELEAHGFRIPDELGYATLDSFQTPRGIGGIDQQPLAVGSAAVDVLTSHLNRNERGLPRVPKLMMIPGGWNQGETLRRHTNTDSARATAPALPVTNTPSSPSFSSI